MTFLVKKISILTKRYSKKCSLTSFRDFGPNGVLGDGLVQECQLTGIPNRDLQPAAVPAHPLVLCDESGHIVGPVCQAQLFEQVADAMVGGLHRALL